MEERFRGRRNWCAVAIGILYLFANLTANALVRLSSPTSASHYRYQAMCAGMVVGLIVAGLFFAACYYAARAKRYPGYVGIAIALAGFFIWAGSAFYLLFQAVNLPLTAESGARLGDGRLPLLPWFAFAFAALMIKALPDRAITAKAG